MKVDCLICRTALQSFHTFEKKALFTKPLREAQPSAAADMALAYCVRCRHISSRLLTDMSMQELHEKVYGELYQNFVPTGLSRLQVAYTDFVAQRLLEWLPPNRHVLEIGCHDGYMLKILRDAGHTCHGIEPSPYADVAREEYGLEVSKAFFQGDSYPPESYDLVVLRHVVEHIDEPVGFVRDALRVLKPGGLLYVEVPNSYWSLEQPFFPEFHADHISYFTMPSLHRLLDEAGADVLHAEAVSAYMRFPFLNTMSRKRSGVHQNKRVEGWFSDFRIPYLLDEFGQKYAHYLRGLRQMRDGQTLVVWGTGSIGTQYAIDAGWGPRDATYVDANPSNHGLVLSVTGHEVNPPSVLAERSFDTVLLASGWEEDVAMQIRQATSSRQRIVRFADLLQPT